MEGEPICGLTTYRGHGEEPGTFMYIAADRCKEEIEETMERCDIEPGLFPYHALLDNQHTATNFYRLSEMDPNVKILFIEGADCLVDQGKISDNMAVAQFLKEAAEYARKRQIAVWFSTGAPKMKKGEEYVNPRDRVLGSVAWARYSSTIFSMAFGDPGMIKDKSRILTIQPRNHAQREFWLSVNDNGCLYELPTKEGALSRMRFLAQMPSSQWVEAKDLVLLGEGLNMSRATVYRHLKDFIEAGTMVKDENGRYMVPAFKQLSEGQA